MNGQKQLDLCNLIKTNTFAHAAHAYRNSAKKGWDDSGGKNVINGNYT